MSLPNVPSVSPLKTRFSFVIDDSGSITASRLAAAVQRNFNGRLQDLAQEAKTHPDQDIRASLYLFGETIERRFHNVPAQHLLGLSSYKPNQGRTALFRAVHEALQDARQLETTDGADCAFVVMAVTDGQDNDTFPSIRLQNLIQECQATGRYTITFLVPPGQREAVARQTGVPVGNVAEWEQTVAGAERADQVTSRGFASYFAARSTGKTASTSFYPDLSQVSPQDLQKVLEDVQRQCTVLTVPADAPAAGVEIQPFVQETLKAPYLPGSCFYELSDRRKAGNRVQATKQILIRDRHSGSIYAGAAARQFLGLPTSGTVTVRPGQHGSCQIYIQSWSNNRKLLPGTGVVYYPRAVR